MKLHSCKWFYTSSKPIWMRDEKGKVEWYEMRQCKICKSFSTVQLKKAS